MALLTCYEVNTLINKTNFNVYQIGHLSEKDSHVIALVYINEYGIFQVYKVFIYLYNIRLSLLIHFLPVPNE